MKNAFCEIAWVSRTTNIHHASRHSARIRDMTKQLFLLCLTKQRAFFFALCRRPPAFSSFFVRAVLSSFTYVFLNSTSRAKVPVPVAEIADSGFNAEQLVFVRHMSVPFEYLKSSGEFSSGGSSFRAAEAAAENTNSIFSVFAGSRGPFRMKRALSRLYGNAGMNSRMLPSNKFCFLSAFI